MRPLWVWVLAGAGLDAGVLAVLWPAAVPFLPKALAGQTWVFDLALMGIAWLVHAALLPCLVQAPGWTSWRAPIALGLLGILFVMVGGLLASAVGLGVGLSILVIGFAFAGNTMGFAGVLVITLVVSAAGGTVAGGIGHACHLGASRWRSWASWSARSDIVGAVVAACIADAGVFAIRAMTVAADGDGSVPAVLTNPSLAVPLGTLALLPHLLLLGLDLRRAARATSPRTSPAPPPTPQP